ncbi:MAG: hydratase [Sphaerochaetaceae bacterium]
MIRLIDEKVFLADGKLVRSSSLDAQEGRRRTMAAGILCHHNVSGNDQHLRIRFDALASHDITYVGIIQTSRASGLTEFPVPYAMTNCHNSLCAVGGTINEDDHAFGLSAARKYGGIYVPANAGVIHTYVRETLARCGAMILGSDSHTRYGALGCMGVGEGGPELVKQILHSTYDIEMPEVVLVYLSGSVRRGTGPHDVALAMIKAVFESGFVKNRVLEFAGPGVSGLSVDFRCAVDVMTTETTCLSSIWETDDKVREYYAIHGRLDDFKPIHPISCACYDRAVEVDLGSIEPMIALPFHPSNAYTIAELCRNPHEILSHEDRLIKEKFGDAACLDLESKIHDGKIYADQGIIAGCAGGIFENICDAAQILKGHSIGNGGFSMSIYPGSVPVQMELARDGVMASLMESGALFKPAFCGPCFGAGDVPANNGFSIRHTTRNFPNREGSRPSDGQLAGVALMDAKSIAATARNHGAITSASDFASDACGGQDYHFDSSFYESRVYNGFGKAIPDETLVIGPNITSWPEIPLLSDNILLRLAAVIHDSVTTTDELIPSGETSSYRSNPLKLAQFTLSRRVPDYVKRSKEMADAEEKRRNGDDSVSVILSSFTSDPEAWKNTQIGSCIYATKPGDGSAREQAASCQKVIGGLANICREYATKRYRSNCINWGIIPFVIGKDADFNHEAGSYVYVPGIRAAIESGQKSIPAKVLENGKVSDLILFMQDMTDDEKQILLQGCLMNYYKAGFGR